MKKLVLSTLLVLASVIGVSAFDWKVSSTIIDSLNMKITNDPVVLEQAQEFADQAVPDSDTQRFLLIRIRALIRFQKAAGNITFDDQKKFIDDQISELKFDGEVKAKDYLDCLYIWWYRGWDNEVYDLMKTLEGHETWLDAGHVCEQLKKYNEAYDYYFASAAWPDRAVNRRDPAERSGPSVRRREADSRTLVQRQRRFSDYCENGFAPGGESGDSGGGDENVPHECEPEILCETH